MLKFEKDNREIDNSLKSSAISRRFCTYYRKKFCNWSPTLERAKKNEIGVILCHIVDKKVAYFLQMLSLTNQSYVYVYLNCLKRP